MLRVCVCVRRLVSVGVFVSVAVAFVAGCSSSDDGGSSTSSASSAEAASSSSASTETSASFCSAFCSKLASCDSSSDEQTCTEGCNSAVRVILEKLRSDVLIETKACWEKSDCRMVLSDTRLTDCIDESVIGVAPSEAVKSFCNDLGESFRKCDSSLSYAACLSKHKMYGDETITQASKCADKACSAIPSCLAATLSF